MSQNIVENKKAEITQFLQEIKQDYRIPGMVVTISGKDGIEYLESFGDVSTDDNFIIGSNSKAFTALIVLRLQEKGLLNINEPVVKYLPWFEFKNKEVSNKITIKNLLHHTSGLSTGIGRIVHKKDENAERVRLKIIELLKGVKVDKYPIKDFDYSSANYQLLGYIIENVTNKEYSTVFKEEIADLFELENTSSTMPNNLAQGYQPFLYYSIIPIEPNYNKVNIPMGYLNSNGRDLSKYLCELMKSYNGDTTSVIGTNITNELFNPNDENRSKYALGWYNYTYKSTQVLLHGGIVESFNSYFIIAPEIEKNIVVLTNHYDNSASPTARGILSILMDREPTESSRLMYYVVRSLPFLVLLTLLIFAFILNKWRKNGSPIGISKKPLPNTLVFIGIVIGLGWIFYAPSLYEATIKNVIHVDVTSGLSLILLSIFTVGISIILYFNKSKTNFA